MNENGLGSLYSRANCALVPVVKHEANYAFSARKGVEDLLG